MTYANPLCDRALEDRFHIALPAGMSNLSWSTREQIKAQHKRRLQRIREVLKAGKTVGPKELEMV
jgi:hypothetical protein